jgi:lactate dehydrogenase-like 2-hydroxyacid dehydrogenase
MTRPLAIRVTRRLPEPVEAQLRSRYDARLREDDLPLDADQLRAALAEYDVILCTLGDHFTREMLEVLPRRTRLLANFGAGVDHIDVDAARDCGISVSNTPGVLTDDTADLTILLILAALRRATEGIRELAAATWSGWRPTHLLGTRAFGATLGIVGFGRIGQAVARRAHHGFGMRIVYHSRREPPSNVVRSLGARRAPSLHALLGDSDVVSLHVPATPETHHLIDAAALAAMRPSSFLVNTARGDVLDEPALIDALGRGVIAGAGLDVFEGEPAVSPELLALPNVFALPHLGSATTESRVAMGERALANIDAFVADRPLPDRVV